LDDAHVTAEENERHSAARRKEVPADPDAPPLVETTTTPATREDMDRLLTTLGQSMRVPDDPPPAV
jgi:hypothetical protein